VDHETVRCSVRDDHPLTLRLYDEIVTVHPDAPVERAVVPLTPLLPPPQQPPGHEPRPHDKAVT
jgi:hypothetical protein